jgi:hypothetical protein
VSITPPTPHRSPALLHMQPDRPSSTQTLFYPSSDNSHHVLILDLHDPGPADNSSLFSSSLQLDTTSVVQYI